MRLRLIAAASGLLSLAVTVPAHGVTCYQIWNNQDVLAYQSSLPPFDLSAPAFDRAMANLRARRGQLIFFETIDCAPVGAIVVGQGQPALDPASLLIDMRGGAAGVPRSGMLAPVPASGGVAPAAPSGGAPINVGTPMNAGAPAKPPGR